MTHQKRAINPWYKKSKWIRDAETYQERTEICKYIVNDLTDQLEESDDKLHLIGRSPARKECKFIDTTLNKIDSKLDALTDSCHRKMPYHKYQLLYHKIFYLCYLVWFNMLRLSPYYESPKPNHI